MEHEPPNRKRVRQSYILGAILLLGLVLRLLVAWAPVEVLVQKTLPDDAFYYFAIAGNILAGSGASVDGVTLTNGFHPLWAAVLLLPFSLGGPVDLPVHLSLTLAALFDLGAAWLAFLVVGRATGSRTGAVLAAGLYALNPLLIMESLNGLETALSVFFFGLAFLVYQSVIVGRKSISPGRGALFGLAVGFMLLGRTDSVLFAIVLGCHALWQGRRRLRTTVPGLLLAALVAAITLVPWLLWNQTALGTIVQSSAVAAPHVFRESLFRPLSEGVPFAHVWQAGFWPVIYLSLLLAFRYTGLAWVALAAALILKRLLVSPTGEDRGDRAGIELPNLLLLPLLGAVLPLLVHTFIRWYPRSWYYVPLVWASAVWVGPALARVGSSLNTDRVGRVVVRAGLAALVLVMGLQGIKSWREGFYPWQIHMLEGAGWAALDSPPDAVIASFNSGLQAYYGQRPIVNLDGVVDWGAVRAAEQRALLSYARQRGATHLVDYEAYLQSQFAPYLEPNYEDCLEPVTTVSAAYAPYGRVMAYRLLPDCPLEGETP